MPRVWHRVTLPYPVQTFGQYGPEPHLCKNGEVFQSGETVLLGTPIITTYRGKTVLAAPALWRIGEPHLLLTDVPLPSVMLEETVRVM